jgi:hypothetical protein
MSEHKKERSTIMLTKETFRATRIYAAKKGMDISSFTELALCEQIKREQEEEKRKQEEAELTGIINVAKRSNQQMRQKLDFNPQIAREFINNILAGIDSKYHYYVVNEITKDEKGEPRHVLLELNIPKLEFPTTKEKILQHIEKLEKTGIDIISEKGSKIEKYGFGIEMGYIKNLPDTPKNKIYNSRIDLEGALQDIFRYNRDLAIWHNKDGSINDRVIGFKLRINEGIEKEKPNLSKQEKELNK